MMNRRSLLGGMVIAATAERLSKLAAAPGTAASGSGARKSILISMLPKELSYLDRFKLAVDVGFNLMEVRSLEDEAEAAKIKDAADKAGLRIHSVMNGIHWRYPLSSPIASEVEASMAGMRRSLRQAKLYGAGAVLLVPAVVRGDTTYEQAWERSQKQIRLLIPEAEKLGVTIAVEEVWNKFLLTARDFNRFIDEFDSPFIQAYFDIGNIVHYGVPQHWIRQLGKRIVRVHLKDYVRRTRQFVNLGDGDVSWPEVRNALVEIGYKGPATLELKGGDRAYLKDVSERVDRLLG